jgi:hypothetical protein
VPAAAHRADAARRPQVLTFDDVAGELSAVLERPVAFRQVTGRE